MDRTHLFLLVWIIVITITSGCASSSPQSVDTSPISPQAITPQGICPHTVEFSIVNAYGNPLVGATVSVTYNSTTASNGNDQYRSGTQTGTTDSSGNIVFNMIGTVKYDVTVMYQGKQMVYQIYPQNPLYLIRMTNVY